MSYTELMARLFALVIALACAGEAYAAQTTAQKLALGSLDIAARKLAADSDDSGGRDLLTFALAVDPDNENALLMLAKIDRGMAIDAPDTPDPTKDFVTFVEGVAKRTTSTDRKLLLCKVLEILDPMNRMALIELTKAKNRGVNTSLGGLIRRLNPSATVGGSSPNTGGSTSVSSETVSNLPPPGAEKIRTTLSELRLSSSTVRSGTMRVFSSIDSSLRTVGARLHYQSTRFPARTYSSSSTSTYYSSSSGLGYGSGFRYALMPSSGSGTGDVSAMEWLTVLGSVYNLKLKYTDASVQIVDDAHGDGVTSGTDPVMASTVFQETKQGMVDFLKKYRGKKVLLRGTVSGSGRSMRDHYVDVAEGNVRIMLSSDVPTARTDYIKRRADYQGWTVYAVAECTGLSGGRLVFDKCRHIGW